MKEANDNEELFELTVHGWLAVGQAYLSIQRSNDMFDKDQCKYALNKVSPTNRRQKLETTIVI